MILMVLCQGELETGVALFDSLENGRKFAKSLPGYQYIKEQVEECTMEYETLNPADFPQYEEIIYKGNCFPVTKLMFPGTGLVDICWQEIPYLDQENQGLIMGRTRVDAYIFPNTQVQAYIKNREQGYERIKALLNLKDYDCWRDFSGSEDGEAILYSKKGKQDGFILSYLDPQLVEEIKDLSECELEKWIASAIGE